VGYCRQGAEIVVAQRLEAGFSIDLGGREIQVAEELLDLVDGNLHSGRASCGSVKSVVTLARRTICPELVLWREASNGGLRMKKAAPREARSTSFFMMTHDKDGRQFRACGSWGLC
jgi:hypothetical protein